MEVTKFSRRWGDDDTAEVVYPRSHDDLGLFNDLMTDLHTTLDHNLDCTLREMAYDADYAVVTVTVAVFVEVGGQPCEVRRTLIITPGDGDLEGQVMELCYLTNTWARLCVTGEPAVKPKKRKV